MIVPQKALEMIKFYEQSNKCALTAYKCPVGQWTIGWGTSFYADGTPVKEGDKITQDEADLMLYLICRNRCTPIIDKLQKLCKRQFNENQLAALFSLLYNIRGADKFCETKCGQALIKGDNEEAMKNWDWCSGYNKYCERVKLKGLVDRRNEEIELFFGVKNYWKYD